MTSELPLGKLPVEVLSQLLAQYPPADSRVVVGPGIGLDCAVLDMGDRYLVAKTDPITFATDRIGWYAVHVNANDVACSGAVPRWFLATLLLPEGRTNARLADEIFGQIAEACESIEASLVGGHTEITFGIDRPIVIGCLLGEVAHSDLITAAGAQAGDAVVLVKGVPIEATAIIATEKAAELAGRFDADFLERCRNFLFDPGISVVAAAAIATQVGQIHALHDPTEGGLATALWEVAEASGCALEVALEDIPVIAEGQALCAAYGLDPLATIASGALLLSTPPANVPRLCAAYAAAGMPCVAIGRVVSGTERAVYATSGDGRGLLSRPTRDEIAKLFE